jgi:hypothetical protein
MQGGALRASDMTLSLAGGENPWVCRLLAYDVALREGIGKRMVPAMMSLSMFMRL